MKLIGRASNATRSHPRASLRAPARLALAFAIASPAMWAPESTAASEAATADAGARDAASAEDPPEGGQSSEVGVGIELGVGSAFGRGLGLGVEIGRRHALALGAGLGIYGNPRGKIPIRGGYGVTLGYRYNRSGWYFGPSVALHPHDRLNTIVTAQGDVGYVWRFGRITLRSGLGAGFASEAYRPGELEADVLAPTASFTLAGGWRF